MKRLKIENIELALKFAYTSEKLEKLKKQLKIENIAGFHCDIWNLYIELVEQYGVGAYSEFKMNGYLVDIYDKMKPDCSFDEFKNVLYFEKDKDGRYILPEIQS